LLLTDVVMPELGGKPLAEELKCLYPDLKVLFTSGYTDNAVIKQGILPVDIAFIQKPFTPMQLAVKIRMILDNKQN
jgi:FixJ family two-component response regulator